MKEPVQPVCSRFHKAVELIGARWSGAIIQTMLKGPARYATIRAAVPEISDRMLCERLRVLENEGLAVRHVIPETPVKIEYELTEKGRALEHAMKAIAEWAEDWIAPDGGTASATRSVAPQPPKTPQSPAPIHYAPAAEQPRREHPRIKPRIPR